LDETREHDAEEFVMALRGSSKVLLETVRDRLRVLPLLVRLLRDRTIRWVPGRRTLVDLQAIPHVGTGAPLTLSERALKRALDIVLAAAAIIILSPILAGVAIAIKLDSPGPVIFRQRRNGFNGNPFVIWKFRTMTVLEDGPCVTQASRSDPRVTRFGQFLRSSSVDELPQLINVVRGDMSLVGPRPHALAHDNVYKILIADYAFRHRVKPGLTGWAQVNGSRGETKHVERMAERVMHDLWYIGHWSLDLDIKILLRTCFVVLRNRAY
jgi:putative colanic acid biosynthesis UDP-glucose lipid carrier transferase